MIPPYLGSVRSYLARITTDELRIQVEGTLKKKIAEGWVVPGWLASCVRGHQVLL